MNTVSEAAVSVPVVEQADVVVAGGGIAGVAAALAARRQGASVLLLEKEYGVGGLATLGNVIVFLPLCDGRGRQVIGGLGEELLRLAVARVRDPIDSMRVGHVPDCWNRECDADERAKHRFRVGFNPVDYQFDLEELLLKEGVAILYDARCCGVTRDGDRITSVLVDSKAGRFAVAGNAFVDATGDADLCEWAGEPTETLATNVPCSWFYTYDPQQGCVQLHPMSNRYDAGGGPPPDGLTGYAGHTPRDITAHVIASHRLIRGAIDDKRRETGHDVVPIHVPSIATFRMTRRLKGRHELCGDDDHRFFDDAVGMTGDWRRAGPIYCVPFDMLAAVRHANLLAAGRCVSATGTAWDVVRAIPTCVVTGQAAGTAAAMLSQIPDGSPATLRLPDLQAELRRSGVIIDRELVARES
jgi:glycine/D-amino acid oxidase-like deaminating enzyme